MLGCLCVYVSACMCRLRARVGVLDIAGLGPVEISHRNIPRHHLTGYVWLDALVSMVHTWGTLVARRLPSIDSSSTCKLIITLQ